MKRNRSQRMCSQRVLPFLFVLIILRALAETISLKNVAQEAKRLRKDVLSLKINRRGKLQTFTYCIKSKRKSCEIQAPSSYRFTDKSEPNITTIRTFFTGINAKRTNRPFYRYGGHFEFYCFK